MLDGWKMHNTHNSLIIDPIALLNLLLILSYIHVNSPQFTNGQPAWGDFLNSIKTTYFLTYQALQPLYGIGLPQECPKPLTVSHLRLPVQYPGLNGGCLHAILPL